MIKDWGYFFREALTSLSRNRLLTLATVSTVAICILILGAAVLMTINAGNFMNRLESDVAIMVYLDDSLSEEEQNEIEKDIKGMEGVQSIQFISKQEALKNLQEQFSGKDYDLEETIGKNPLPDSFEVKAVQPEDVKKIAQSIENMPGVDKVNYGQGVVERLFSVTRWVRIVGIGLIILLALAAVFLIATTIRLAVFARRKEIYLMKLVGATNWFVRWPFFIEGVLLGSLGALLAILLLVLGYSSLLDNLHTTMFFVPLVSSFRLLINVYISLFLTGAILGVFGTWFSLNRFLDV